MKRCCPEGKHLRKQVIWERTTVHVSSRAIGLLDFNRSDTQIYLSAWPPGSPGQKWCVFLLEHQGHQWQCHMQAEYTGRLSFASISPQTSAGPVKDLILGSGGGGPPPLSRDGLQPRLSPSSASGPVGPGMAEDLSARWGLLQAKCRDLSELELVKTAVAGGIFGLTAPGLCCRSDYLRWKRRGGLERLPEAAK